jgi:thioredoxin-dependent peroxiredoxin
VLPPPACFMNLARFSRLVLVWCWIEFSLLLAANPPTDFTLRAPVTGQTFRLSEAKGSYVVLQFLLKTECPVCLRHTRSHFLNAGNLKGTVQLFVKPDGTEALTAWARQLGEEPSPVIYQDPDAALATAFSIPDGYAFHGETVHYPALLILDPQGREVFRYVGKDNSDRYSVKQLNQKLTELRSGTKGQP